MLNTSHVMDVVTPPTAVAADLDHDERIAALLDDIAERRIRLDELFSEVNNERVRLRSSVQRLNETWARIWQEGDSRLFAGRVHPAPARGAATLTSGWRHLTSREIEVLRLIAGGLSTKQIAAELKIAFKTAVCHRSHILQKTKCHESASLVRLAIQSGLVA